jgi:hypothetical protein
MSGNPRNSVVNEYCQTHDVPNLFIVGSPVFSTISGTPADGHDRDPELPNRRIYLAPEALVWVIHRRKRALTHREEKSSLTPIFRFKNFSSRRHVLEFV